MARIGLTMLWLWLSWAAMGGVFAYFGWLDVEFKSVARWSGDTAIDYGLLWLTVWLWSHWERVA